MTVLYNKRHRGRFQGDGKMFDLTKKRYLYPVLAVAIAIGTTEMAFGMHYLYHPSDRGEACIDIYRLTPQKLALDERLLSLDMPSSVSRTAH